MRVHPQKYFLTAIAAIVMTAAATYAIQMPSQQDASVVAQSSNDMEIRVLPQFPVGQKNEETESSPANGSAVRSLMSGPANPAVSRPLPSLRPAKTVEDVQQQHSIMEVEAQHQRQVTEFEKQFQAAYSQFERPGAQHTTGETIASADAVVVTPLPSFSTESPRAEYPDDRFASRTNADELVGEVDPPTAFDTAPDEVSKFFGSIEEADAARDAQLAADAEAIVQESESFVDTVPGSDDVAPGEFDEFVPEPVVSDAPEKDFVVASQDGAATESQSEVQFDLIQVAPVEPGVEAQGLSGSFDPAPVSAGSNFVGLPEQSFESAPMQTAFGTQGLGSRDITWWKSRVNQPLVPTNQFQHVNPNALVYHALKNSPRIMGLSQDPLIRELQVVEADSEFDAVRYVRSQFEDRVDPVGNDLTTGNGDPFLKDNIWSADLGLRKKARTGATYELNQRLGFQNSNSNFFSPQDQGTATLALNVTQPLMRGRGRYYNQSQILIAQSVGGVAWDTFQADLQDELLAVVSEYWKLYLERSVYLQKQENVRRGAAILDRLEGRSGLDSLPSQIARARASVMTRKTELANSFRDVRNTETEVRRLIADRSWVQSQHVELLPMDLPVTEPFDVPFEQVVYAALENRPEIKAVMKRARVATIQRDVSANELMPELSLLMGTYVSALRGESGLVNAFQDQFGQVKPGYNVGFNFELPYRNRAARSRLAQRNLQLKKIGHEVDEVMQTVIAEAQVAMRRVNSAAETLRATDEAIRAARADLAQFENRWDSFAFVEGDLADGQSPTTILDQLLDSQERLAFAEKAYVESEVELKIAEVALRRAMGTLLQTEGVNINRTIRGDEPNVELSQNQSQDIMVDGGSFGQSNVIVEPNVSQGYPMEGTETLGTGVMPMGNVVPMNPLVAPSGNVSSLLQDSGENSPGDSREFIR